MTPLILLLLLADPHVVELKPITWSWEHPQPGLGYWLQTNGVPWFDFGTNGFGIVAGETNVMTGQSPPLKPGAFTVTITAKDAASESDPSSPPVKLTVDPITPPVLSIKKASPFEATFSATNWATWEVQGSTDAAVWFTIGMATERTPGEFYFLDIAARTNIFYRVKTP